MDADSDQFFSCPLRKTDFTVPVSNIEFQAEPRRLRTDIIVPTAPLVVHADTHQTTVKYLTLVSRTFPTDAIFKLHGFS